MFISATDPRLSFFCPQPVNRERDTVRLERFPSEVYTALDGQIGPTANLRSSSGCAVVFATDSPVVTLRLDRLRHHQYAPSGLACEVETGAGWRVTDSLDLRAQSGAVAVPFATGLERGGGPREAWLWLPLISTCAVAGVEVADGAAVAPVALPEPRWLAIGDSLTQGFVVQSPAQCWVHLLSRRWRLPAWNLGIGGVRIEPAAFAWALRSRRWELVTIALGSNHAWREGDTATVAESADELMELVLSGGPGGAAHGRVAWCLPSWKPYEDGQGPADFAGQPLDAATADRMRRVRDALRRKLATYAPRLELVEDLMPHEARYFVDGLHPAASGSSLFADRLAQALPLTPSATSP
jgi:lysophospholipase L1-like esterase